MERRVSWGVLSTAKIGIEKVLPAMQAGTITRIDAIASRDGARAGQAARQLGIPRSYDSYEALLADPDIEVIYNPLPNHLHVPWTIRAMEAGKHVLCEKPIALSAGEAQQLLEVRNRTGRLVAEAFMVRQHPQWHEARHLALNGRIGEARAIQTFFSYFLLDPANVRNQADIGGGGLMDIGCYAIATARYIFGDEPERVIGLFDRDPVMRIDRLGSGMAEFPGKRHLTFTCATQLSAHQRVTIVGTKGRVEVVIPFNAPTDVPCRLVVDDGSALGGASAAIEELAVCNQYTLQGDMFSRAVLGEIPAPYPIEDAVLNMRVIDALFRSAETGRWERP